MQDNELIKRIRQGDKLLFSRLAEKYYDDVFRYCYYQTGDEQAAWDCTQDTFCHLIRYLDNYTEQGRFKAYLLRIALNACRDYFRKNGRENFSFEELSGQDGDSRSPGSGFRIQTAAGFPSRDSCLEDQAEKRLMIQNGLNLLPDLQREAVILYFYYGYKQREIARITGVPVSTVKTRLRTGIGRLREYFRDNGLLP